MVKILERRLTRNQRAILDRNGLLIEKYPAYHCKRGEERISYDQYRLYLFSRGNYIGMTYEIYLWGPGLLIQFEDMHYEYFIGE